jgi:hypothetical protein
MYQVIPRLGVDPDTDDMVERIWVRIHQDPKLLREWTVQASLHGVSVEEYTYRVVAYRMKRWAGVSPWAPRLGRIEPKFEDIRYE